MTNYRIKLILCGFSYFALSSCSKEKETPITEKEIERNYSVCDNGLFKESEFSNWVPVTDMQLISDNLAKGKYFAFVEGRNNGGLSEYRWVEKDFPSDFYSKYDIRAEQSDTQFRDRGLRLRRAGYIRKSLQVFIDGSGIARHQSLWLKPKLVKLNDNQNDKVRKETAKPTPYDQIAPGAFPPSSTFRQPPKPIKKSQ